MADLKAALMQIPPATRTLLVLSVAVTGSVLLGIVDIRRVLFSWPRISSKWELWRFITPFFFVGKGMDLLFNLFIFYRNSSFLETSLYQNTADYVWCLLFNFTLIIATNIPLDSYLLFFPLSSSLLYLWSKASPYSSISFYGFITIPAPWAPYAMLALDFLQGGPPRALQSLTGMASAYAWWWFREEKGLGEHAAATPKWIESALQLVGSGARRASQGVQYGQTLGATPRNRDGGGSGTGAPTAHARTRWSSGDEGARTSGHNWGSGQRLGG